MAEDAERGGDLGRVAPERPKASARCSGCAVGLPRTAYGTHREQTLDGPREVTCTAPLRGRPGGWGQGRSGGWGLIGPRR